MTKGNGGAGRRLQRNVLGKPLETCSIKPMTGFTAMTAATPDRRMSAVT
jgi:uncharacterized protein (DUF2237 family)